MFSHLTVGTHDLRRATAFYDAVLSPLGIERVSGKYQNWAAGQRPGEAATHWALQPPPPRCGGKFFLYGEFT